MVPAAGGNGSGFKATPQDITDAAYRVSTIHMPNYSMAIGRLYQAVEALEAAWPGTDGATYVNKIKEKRPSIVHVLEVLAQYTNFMRESVGIMDDTQTGVTGQASKL